MTAQPESVDLDEWVRELADRFLLCRDLGHNWKPARAGIETQELRGGRAVYWRVMRCTRCRTEREQWLSASGHVVSGGYAYSDGYLKPAHTGPVNRDTLRLSSVLRLIEREGN